MQHFLCEVKLQLHFLTEGEGASGKNDEYTPWPNYSFTGKLRPYPQSPRRVMPDDIGRPDYADHPQGYPLSEQAVKGSSQIKVLDDEEIEGKKC